jgi:hypothetical protein
MAIPVTFQIQLLAFLFVISALIFLSSFISVSYHANEFKDLKHKLFEGSKHIFEVPIPPTTTTTHTQTIRPSPSLRSGDTTPQHKTLQQVAYAEDDEKASENEKDEGEEEEVEEDEPENKVNNHKKKVNKDNVIQWEFSKRKDNRCLVNFPPKCPIHPYIHYWDDDTDCFESPLRKSSGLTAKNEDRKFIVFQPDLGGWNNIRMALEVVILFAVVNFRRVVVYFLFFICFLLGNWQSARATS